MDVAAAFEEHVAEVQAACERALERSAAAGRSFDGVVFHAGSPGLYHADDQTWPFRSVPHFARWVPLSGPGHLVAASPGDRPRLVRVVARDEWHGEPAPSPLPEATLANAFSFAEAPSVEAAGAHLGGAPALGGFAYVGSDPAVAGALGIGPDAVEPAELLTSLDWDRGLKTAYEVECIRAAAELAARGHRAARDAARAGESELAIHAAYLAAAVITESETPYPNIIALNEAAAVLHYTGRRNERAVPAYSFLIDAGATCRGYASDITRSYALDDAHPVFVALLGGMEELQAELAASVAPGSYVELHLRAASGVCALLSEVGVLRVGALEALERELDRSFLPHGLGHHLGLQVHDVGGHLLGPEGLLGEPPARAPHLRTTRPLAPGHVVTIEPGLYFIGQRLEALRAGPHGDLVDWPLVEALQGHGGIRIEDDVWVTREGSENLSRPFLPGGDDV